MIDTYVWHSEPHSDVYKWSAEISKPPVIPPKLPIPKEVLFLAAGAAIVGIIWAIVSRRGYVITR